MLLRICLIEYTHVYVLLHIRLMEAHVLRALALFWAFYVGLVL